jgi:hypothetical protein
LYVEGFFVLGFVLTTPVAGPGLLGDRGLRQAARHRITMPEASQRTPPPVASTGQSWELPKRWFHTSWPVSRFQASSSPMWSAPGAI